MPQCTACGLTSESLKRCVRCKSAHYCTEACQTSDWPVHMSHCKPNYNYVLRFQVYPDEIVDPPVWRTLSIPATTTFAKLHLALQQAFYWVDNHTYEFVVNDPDYKPRADNNYILDHIKKASQIDALMGDTEKWKGDPHEPREYLLRIWDDAPKQPGYDPYWGQKKDRVHLPNQRHPRTPTKAAHSTMIYQVLEQRAYRGKSMTYIYDLGDFWRHEIKLEGTADLTDTIVCTDGRGHPIMEDCGSSQGWNDVLKVCRAYRAGNPTQELKDEMEMLEIGDALGMLYDLREQDGAEEVWDKDEVNRCLARLA